MPDKIHRRKIVVNGIVQGVGFRPFVFNLARRYGLVGLVGNTSAGVRIEAEGEKGSLDDFENSLREELPPQAVLTSFHSEHIPIREEISFTIDLSATGGPVATQVAPDLAVCRDCLRELFDPADRRYLYPFINCTNCGPRYSIITGIPYDRAATAMRHFRMCELCQLEYDDPADRRFHAQPNACAVCGPQLSLCDKNGRAVSMTGREALTEAVRLLSGGQILAVKGLGGFHLACDATDDEAVRRLRRRKNREEKPLAVMVVDLAAAQRICVLSPLAEKELCSPGAPIVIAPSRTGNVLAPSVAPGGAMLGVMLAYTPLHHLVLQEFGGPLVMTSGNLSEEPICIDNDEALARLAAIADHFLVHDRNIYMRSDDSVVMEMGGRVRNLRRGRGYVPRPIQLGDDGPAVLAVGGELKGAICFTRGSQAFPGQHLGDIKNLEAYAFLQETVVHLGKIFEIEPQLVVHDLHPAYLSTRWATEEQDLPTLAVQHHHAHLTSCLAENRSSGPAIGLILDGTGYGDDRTIWGGEILVGDLRSCKRLGRLEPMPLPGGDAAIKAPWRTALAYLEVAHDGVPPDLPFLGGHHPGPVLEMLKHDVSCPMTSSCGRLFDAVEAMSGGRQTIAYEGQAAIELMEIAGRGPCAPYSWDITDNGDIFHLIVRPMIRQIAGDILADAGRSQISRRFHRTLAEMMLGAAKRARDSSDINTVVLSGGVFNNYLLRETLGTLLAENDFKVLTHTLVPSGDGGVSLGQAVIGRQWLQDNHK